jgi:pimeloyl-ACP methyl ester carboxylesterase
MLTESHLDLDGVRLRYAETGQGSPLVHVHGGPPTPAHDLLARQFRVITLETSSLGPSPETAATAIGRALTSLGIENFNLMATSDGSAAALRLALAQPERVRTLVLESPTAIGGGSELERRLPEVTMPTLALFGTGDRPDVQQTGRVYAGIIPNGHLVFVYGAAHAIGHDRPEAFAEVVADFLERHEAFVINRTPTVIHP